MVRAAHSFRILGISVSWVCTSPLRVECREGVLKGLGPVVSGKSSKDSYARERVWKIVGVLEKGGSPEKLKVFILTLVAWKVSWIMIRPGSLLEVEAHCVIQFVAKTIIASSPASNPENYKKVNEGNDNIGLSEDHGLCVAIFMDSISLLIEDATPDICQSVWIRSLAKG